MPVRVKSFFDGATFTVTHVVVDAAGAHCAIIDPVLSYDAAAGRTSTAAAEPVAVFIEQQGLKVEWILETHVHADHLTAASYLQGRVGGKICIGARVPHVQRHFARLFNIEAELACDGSQFDRLLEDGETIAIGSLSLQALPTPGHTQACMTYVVGDAAFVGDTLFMPDYGTARTDFPGGDARTLYRSIKQILQLPAATRLFMCHDYGAPGRPEFKWETSVAEQRRSNIHIADGVTETEFVEFRRSRDRELQVPALLLPAVQVNIRAGALPPPESNGLRFIKIPLDAI